MHQQQQQAPPPRPIMTKLEGVPTYRAVEYPNSFDHFWEIIEATYGNDFHIALGRHSIPINKQTSRITIGDNVEIYDDTSLQSAIQNNVTMFYIIIITDVHLVPSPPRVALADANAAGAAANVNNQPRPQPPHVRNLNWNENEHPAQGVPQHAHMGVNFGGQMNGEGAEKFVSYQIFNFFKNGA